MPVDAKKRAIMLSEIRGLFFQKRIYHFVPLLLFGLVLMAWIYPIGSPAFPVIVIVVLGLEPQFNNILFRSPNELEALSLFPICWREIILAKNIATIALFLVFMILSSMVLFYFSPDRVTRSSISEAALYIATIVFPLLHFGNEHSIRHPRRSSGIRLDDLVQSVWMCVNLALLSIPYYLFSHLQFSWAYCLAYGFLTAAYWYRYLLRKTASTIEQEFARLCLTA